MTCLLACLVGVVWWRYWIEEKKRTLEPANNKKSEKQNATQTNKQTPTCMQSSCQLTSREQHARSARVLCPLARGKTTNNKNREKRFDASLKPIRPFEPWKTDKNLLKRKNIALKWILLKNHWSNDNFLCFKWQSTIGPFFYQFLTEISFFKTKLQIENFFCTFLTSTKKSVFLLFLESNRLIDRDSQTDWTQFVKGKFCSASSRTKMLDSGRTPIPVPRDYILPSESRLLSFGSSFLS